MARSEKNLTAVFTDTASAIRAKIGTTETICPLDFADKINAIRPGGMKAFFEAGGKCAYSSKAKSFNGIINYSDTENITDASRMFYQCNELVEAPNMDLSNVTNTSYMFGTCSQLTKVPQLNTSKVKDMSYMFYMCANLKDITLGDTSNVNDMSYMFYMCSYSLKRVKNLDTSWAYNTSNMFAYDYGLTEIPSLNLRRCSNMERMFLQCSSLTTLPEIKTLNGINFKAMFAYCTKLVSVPLLVTDKNKSVDMSETFSGCEKLTSIPAIDARFVTNLYDAFYLCKSLETIHMKDIHVSFDISASTKFTRAALLEIINNLHTIVPTSATPIQTLTMGETNLAKLTDEDKAIATNKGWTLA